MTPTVLSMVAVTYVRDIDTSRAFYELLGFREVRQGSSPTSAWLALHHDEHSVLLASTSPSLDIPRLPLLFFFYLDDVDAAVAIVKAAGLEAHHMGYPAHALGGEVKLLDPDGNTVLIGQRERSASQPEAPDGGPSSRFSLLREAAALVEARGGTTATCQAGNPPGTPCPRKAEVKLADSGGDTVWACLAHADEILVTVPGAFIADQGDRGIAGFLAHRGG